MLNTAKHYKVIIEFSNFLKENCDKLFEKNSKLTLNVEQLLILQKYLIEKFQTQSQSSSNSNTKSANLVSKDILLLYKSSHLHFIQDFLFKVTNIKISGDGQLHDTIKLNIFGSLTFLELKNCNINNIVGIQNLRTQLEVLICSKCVSKLQDILQLCGADQSSPLLWSKLHTLNLSNNSLQFLDNSFRLTPSIEVLDLSNNKISECGGHLRNLTKLKRLYLSFNRFETLPDISETNSNLQLLDMSHNNLEKLDLKRLYLMEKLNYLNISSNFICNQNELNNLKCLRQLNQLILNGNPIVYKSYLVELKVKEILSNKKKPNDRPQNDVTKPGEAIGSSRKQYVTQNLIINSGGLGHPNPAINKLKKHQSRRMSSAIRCVDLGEVTSAASGDDVNGDMAQSPLSSSFYDSFDLQNELNKLKTSRKMYGAQWLLSSPKLSSTLQAHFEQKAERYSESNLARESKDNNNESISEATSQQQQQQQIKEMDNEDLDESELDAVIDTYAVNKLNEQNLKCFLSINEKYLVERDDTNSVLLNYFKCVSLIDGTIDKISSAITLNFEKNMRYANCEYQFENSDELSNFIERLGTILLNEINIHKCQVYLCNKCDMFRSKANFNETANLMCENCKEYLIKDNIIQISNKSKEIEGFTLKDVLKSENKSKEPSTKNEVIPDARIEAIETETMVTNQEQPTTPATSPVDSALSDMLKNTQITKSEIDQIIRNSNKLDNNLKLYLLMNLLNDDQKAQDSDEDGEKFVSKFILKLFLHKNIEENANDNLQLTDCLCLLTNKNIFIFNINDYSLYAYGFMVARTDDGILDNPQSFAEFKFDQCRDFDKCLKKEFIIGIDKIEIIEISNGQHSILIKINNEQDIVKLCTFDIYETQAFLNILLKIINESNNYSSLKQIRKKIEQTEKNLVELLSTNSHTRHIIANHSESLVDLFSFILIENDQTIKEMFLYNNEYFVIIEENLSYFRSNNTKQFNLVEIHKIIDIANMRLFKDDDRKVELCFIDESNNSRECFITFYLNKQFLLGQFIIKIKSIWEEIFFIDLPINY